MKSLWHRRSERRVGQGAVTLVKRRNGWRMSCDVGEVTERLENELSSFSNPSVALPTSQLILLPFRCFTYITAHSATLFSPFLRHRLFTYVTSRSRPCWTHYMKERMRNFSEDVMIPIIFREIFFIKWIIENITIFKRRGRKSNFTVNSPLPVRSCLYSLYEHDHENGTVVKKTHIWSIAIITAIYIH